MKQPKSSGHSEYGVWFSPEQWAAAMEPRPRWDLNPPQREEFDSDHSYALDLLDYANRVLETRKEAK